MSAIIPLRTNALIERVRATHRDIIASPDKERRHDYFLAISNLHRAVYGRSPDAFDRGTYVALAEGILDGSQLGQYPGVVMRLEGPAGFYATMAHKFDVLVERSAPWEELALPLAVLGKAHRAFTRAYTLEHVTIYRDDPSVIAHQAAAEVALFWHGVIDRIGDISSETLSVWKQMIQEVDPALFPRLFSLGIFQLSHHPSLTRPPLFADAVLPPQEILTPSLLRMIEQGGEPSSPEEKEAVRQIGQLYANIRKKDALRLHAIERVVCRELNTAFTLLDALKELGPLSSDPLRNLFIAVLRTGAHPLSHSSWQRSFARAKGEYDALSTKEKALAERAFLSGKQGGAFGAHLLEWEPLSRSLQDSFRRIDWPALLPRAAREVGRDLSSQTINSNED